MPGTRTPRSLDRRAQAMERWLADPSLLRADADATYAAVIEIDVSSITEPLVACPNDPDDVRPLSEVAGRRVDEVFIGSCMTNIGHFRAAGQVLATLPGPVPTRLWIAPPTRMDEAQLRQEGYYGDLRRGRGPHRESRLLAVHGESGPGAGGLDGVLDLHPQLPQPHGPGRRRVPRVGGVGRRGRRVGLASRRPRSTSVSSSRSTPCDPTSTATWNSTRRRLRWPSEPGAPGARTRYPARMCLLVFAWKTEPGFPLVVAANRDERLDRPAHSLCVLRSTRRGSSAGGTIWPGEPGWRSTSTGWSPA